MAEDSTPATEVAKAATALKDFKFRAWRYAERKGPLVIVLCAVIGGLLYDRQARAEWEKQFWNQVKTDVSTLGDKYQTALDKVIAQFEKTNEAHERRVDAILNRVKVVSIMEPCRCRPLVNNLQHNEQHVTVAPPVIPPTYQSLAREILVSEGKIIDGHLRRFVSPKDSKGSRDNSPDSDIKRSDSSSSLRSPDAQHPPVRVDGNSRATRIE